MPWKGWWRKCLAQKLYRLLRGQEDENAGQDQPANVVLS
jgi:hypothetical protein